jgi:hypothetical protein
MRNGRQQRIHGETPATGGQASVPPARGYLARREYTPGAVDGGANVFSREGREPCRGATRVRLVRPFRASKQKTKMEWLRAPPTQAVGLGFTHIFQGCE